MADCTCNMFDTQIVMSACQMSIKKLQFDRTERSENELDEWRTYRKYGIFGPRLTRTSDEIRELLKHINIWDQLDYRWSLHWHEEEEIFIKKILTYAGSIESSQIALTLEEFSPIAKYYKPLKVANV